MQGASPLASPGLNLRGTGRWGRTTRPEVGLSPAALVHPAAVVPEGGLAPSVAGSAGVGGTLRGACPLCRPPTPPLAFFFAPIPPTPFPAGRGGILLYFAGGSAPGTPGIKPLAALTEPAKQVPGATESPRFALKPTETPFYWQCRQPRRGGTGGEELSVASDGGV